MAKNKYTYDGKTWDIEVNNTTATLSATFVTGGVARNEFVVKEGTPEEIKKFIGTKKCKTLYAWNIKVLTREVLNKGGFIKNRETATIQAEGIDGEGKKYQQGDATDMGDEGTGLVDTKNERLKRKAMNAGKILYLEIAGIVLLAIAVIGGLVYIIKNAVR
jgi:hypothetical protein